MKVVKGGVTSPKGFEASALNCGIKRSGRKDLALLYSIAPSICTARFTSNKVRSGSVVFSERVVRRGIAQAVVVNSGNANCCIGKKEIKDANDIASIAADNLGLGRGKVLIASTGIIGKKLPVDKIKKRLPLLVNGLDVTGGTDFAKAIMTTDTVHKEMAVKLNIGGTPVTIGGSVKGSGMICPDMATMLAFFTTDAAIEEKALISAFKESVRESFNRITVDGDMSTNDSAFLFANSLAGNRCIREGSTGYSRFLKALKFISAELAKKIVLDGEGATKFVEIIVKGAQNKKDADRAARHVADSNLIKTMIAGGDPNWGRVAASVGSSGVNVKKDRIDIYFGRQIVMRKGNGVRVKEKLLSDIFKKKEIGILIDLKSGRFSGKVWTCDLTEEYVRINAEYET